MTAEAIARLAREKPGLGLGVAGGYGGLVPVDVDTDDDDIRKVVESVLGKPVVEKAGKRGWTGFWRAAGKIEARKFRRRQPGGKSGPPIIEILTTGQTVLPPTMHPDMGQPYRWKTRRTLYTVPLVNLTAVTPRHIDLLAVALGCETPPAVSPRKQPGHQSKIDRHFLAYARKALRQAAAELAATGKGDRHNRLRAQACKLGVWVHHGVLTQAEVEGALIAACKQNGYFKEAGARLIYRTIRYGLEMSKHNELPVLQQHWGRSDGR
jgi:hypothetical protein